MDFSKVKRSLIAKIRLSCHSLNIETMRYCRPKVVRHQRFCPLCPDAVESEKHFLLHCKKYDSLRKNSKFISETMQDLGIGADTVKHILNPQTKQNCKSVAHFIDDALHVRKSSISLLLFLYSFHKETSVFLMEYFFLWSIVTTITCIILVPIFNGRIMSHVNWMPGLMMA